MQNKTVTLVVSIIVITLTTLFFYKGPSCSDHNLCLKVFGNPTWHLIETYENTNTTWRGIFSINSSFVRVRQVRGVSPSDSEMFMKARLAQIESQYEPERSPYPGIVSDAIVCPGQYMPSFHDGTFPSGETYRSFSAYVNYLLQYGSCTKEQIKYGADTVLFYCKNIKRWYEVEIFTPINLVSQNGETQSAFNRFTCNI